MACLVTGRTLVGHIPRQLCALLPRTSRSSPWQLGDQPLRGPPVGRWALPGFPAGRSPDRLQASQKRHRLDLPRGRLVVDAHRSERLLRRLRRGPAGSVPFPVVVAGINNWLWVPAVGVLGTYLLLLFPDGRLPSSRWRPLAWLCGAVLV